MKKVYTLIWIAALAVGSAQAQGRKAELAPYTAAGMQKKNAQLDMATSAFRAGAVHEGLVLMADVYAFDPTDENVTHLYRQNATKFAIRIAEDCDVQAGFSHCDSALKYVELARTLGDSSVYHEVRAQAMYQKVLHLEEADFNALRPEMPSRSLTPNMAYRYLPEERKIFFRDLINETIEEISIARGEVERKEKVQELLAKMKVIERSQRIIGTR